jgi:hypothetical protein
MPRVVLLESSVQVGAREPRSLAISASNLRVRRRRCDRTQRKGFLDIVHFPASILVKLGDNEHGGPVGQVVPIGSHPPDNVFTHLRRLPVGALHFSIFSREGVHTIAGSIQRSICYRDHFRIRNLLSLDLQVGR